MKQLLLLGLALDEARRLAVAQQRQRALDQIERLLGLLRLLADALGLLLQRVDALLQAVQVGEHQLGLDRLDVGDRIDAALDMGHVVVLEAAHHMGDGVDLADVGEELVAEALALRGAAHQARDVDERQPRRHDLLGLGELRQRVEPRIGHRHLADVRLDGAERIVRRLRRRRLRQCIEERRLADIGHADDAAFESHDVLLLVLFAVVVRVGPEALGVHGEMHLVLEACVLAARQELGVVGDDVGQRLDPVALALGKSLST